MITRHLKRRMTLLSAVGLLLVQPACDRDGVETIVSGGTAEGPATLIAARTQTPPVLDGMAVSNEWEQAAAISVVTEVPAIEAFAGYEGRGYQVILKSMYDDSHIYFLAQWDDPQIDLDRETWFFDPAERAWKQESRWPQFADGSVSRRPFYEDKLSLIWEATPVAGFGEQGCWVACHTGLNPNSNNGGKTALKYTNAAGEVLDMWHWKSVRNTSQDTYDDQYTDSQRSARNGGRKSDPGTGAYSNNKQTLNGVSVPKFIIPDAPQRYYWVETDGSNPVLQDAGLALAVTDVDAMGALTLSDGTAIDPNTDVRYHRDGSQLPPSVFTRPVEGDRGDIDAVGRYTGVWTLEFRRSLETGSGAMDVQFSDLGAVFPFGVAVFDNAAIAHAVSTESAQLRFSE